MTRISFKNTVASQSWLIKTLNFKLCDNTSNSLSTMDRPEVSPSEFNQLHRPSEALKQLTLSLTSVLKFSSYKNTWL